MLKTANQKCCHWCHVCVCLAANMRCSARGASTAKFSSSLKSLVDYWWHWSRFRSCSSLCNGSSTVGNARKGVLPTISLSLLCTWISVWVCAMKPSRLDWFTFVLWISCHNKILLVFFARTSLNLLALSPGCSAWRQSSADGMTLSPPKGGRGRKIDWKPIIINPSPEVAWRPGQSWGKSQFARPWLVCISSSSLTHHHLLISIVYPKQQLLLMIINRKSGVWICPWRWRLRRARGQPTRPIISRIIDHACNVRATHIKHDNEFEIRICLYLGMYVCVCVFLGLTNPFENAALYSQALLVTL